MWYDGCLDETNDYGCSLLHFAGLSKDVSIVRWLDSRPNVDWCKRQNGGHSSIDKAAIQGWREGIKVMWKGEEIDLTKTWKGGEEGRKWLVEKGLIVDDKDKDDER